MNEEKRINGGYEIIVRVRASARASAKEVIFFMCVLLAESFLNGRRGGTVYHRRRGTKKVPENLKKFFPGKNCACLVVYHRILVLKRVFGGFQARKAVLAGQHRSQKR